MPLDPRQVNFFGLLSQILCGKFIGHPSTVQEIEECLFIAIANGDVGVIATHDAVAVNLAYLALLHYVGAMNPDKP